MKRWLKSRLFYSVAGPRGWEAVVLVVAVLGVGAWLAIPTSHRLTASALAGGLKGTSGTTGSTGPTGAAPNISYCVDPVSLAQETCPPPPAWLASGASQPYDDIDQQPRPITYQGSTWVPITPEGGCPTQSSYLDAGADEAYFGTCAPLAWTWADSTNPKRRLNDDGTITMTGAPDPGSAANELLQWHVDLQPSTLYRKWVAANPKESATLEAWWKTPTLPLPTPATAFGKSFLDAARAYHYDVGDHP